MIQVGIDGLGLEAFEGKMFLMECIVLLEIGII